MTHCLLFLACTLVECIGERSLFLFLHPPLIKRVIFVLAVRIIAFNYALFKSLWHTFSTSVGSLLIRLVRIVLVLCG